MTREDLEQLLGDIKRSRIAVVGDFCLDVYWFIDMAASEASVETGKPTHPVSAQKCSLGGAGNVVCNLVDMGVGTVVPFGVVGHDVWGREMLRLLGEKRVDTAGVLTQEAEWSTLVYCKPYLSDVEQNRMDFGNFNRLSAPTAARLVAAIGKALPGLDVVIVNEQVPQGIHTESFRRGLAELILANPGKTFVVDSRHHSLDFPGAWLKINDSEAAGLCGIAVEAGKIIPEADAAGAAAKLYARQRKPVFITRGSRGCMVHDAGGVSQVPGPHVLGAIDTVGAGDSMCAGIAAALACGRDPGTAAELGSYVAAVTIQKLRQTGTATPAEILRVGVEPDYVYRPELADDSRRARYLPGTEFEIVTAIPAGMKVTHAIFDHDGTISTLRQGWEAVMEPMMVRAVLGEHINTADESVYQRVTGRVREFVEKTTGIQTIVQMQGLVDMVREFGFVPEGSILDAAGYKNVYNEALIRIVRDRLARLEQGVLDVSDFTVKNAPKLLQALRDAGVKLFLASGTDQQDLVNEAEALGYAGLFDGRIYGSVGDIARDAKKMVLERILADIGPAGAANIVVFGDGPVEIRETHKRGGFAIGVASDELRRFGMNTGKRARLIKAGADLIIPDFSQLQPLLDVLFGRVLVGDTGLEPVTSSV